MWKTVLQVSIIQYYIYSLPVTRWVTNTIKDQFDRNAILTVYMLPFRIKDSYGRQEFFNLPFVADNLSKKDQSRIEVYRMWDFQYSRIRMRMRILHFDIRGYRMRILYILLY